jgi:hypothetical protein
MTTMRKTLVVLVSLLAALGTTAAATAWANGPRPSANAPASAPDQSDHELNGTWATTVQLTDAPPGAPTSCNALDTFLTDGGLLVSSSAANPASRGLAHGTWTHLAHRNFTATFVWFRFDPSGQPVGTQRVQRTMKVSRDGSSFTATDLIEVIAPSGAVLATIHGTEVGQLLPN